MRAPTAPAGLVLAVVLAAMAPLAASATEQRPPSSALLATVTGAQYRVTYPGDPGEWFEVGDETSLTIEPDASVQARGWQSTCSITDASGRVLVSDRGLAGAVCELAGSVVDPATDPAGEVDTRPASSSTRPTATPAATGRGSAPSAGLQIAPDDPAARATYARARFGDGWAPAGRPGCDTRDRVLARDVHPVTAADRCGPLAGTLRDPDTGRLITGPTRALDIDHVVPLALAWRSGAAAWTPAERERFANDMANLRTTTAGGNRSKGDDGPEQWMPSADPCGYAHTFAAVVERYGLTVTAARAQALDQGCS